MSVANARANLRDARRDLADAIDNVSKSFFTRARSKQSKQGKMRRSIGAIDRALADLRGL